MAGRVWLGPSRLPTFSIARPWLAMAIRPDHEGAATLVPPISYQSPMPSVSSYESYIATPVLGSASQATSGMVRWPVLWNPCW